METFLGNDGDNPFISWDLAPLTLGKIHPDLTAANVRSSTLTYIKQNLRTNFDRSARQLNLPVKNTDPAKQSKNEVLRRPHNPLHGCRRHRLSPRAQAKLCQGRTGVCHRRQGIPHLCVLRQSHCEFTPSRYLTNLLLVSRSATLADETYQLICNGAEYEVYREGACS